MKPNCYYIGTPDRSMNYPIEGFDERSRFSHLVVAFENAVHRMNVFNKSAEAQGKPTESIIEIGRIHDFQKVSTEITSDNYTKLSLINVEDIEMDGPIWIAGVWNIIRTDLILAELLPQVRFQVMNPALGGEVKWFDTPEETASFIRTKMDEIGAKFSHWDECYQANPVYAKADGFTTEVCMNINAFGDASNGHVDALGSGGCPAENAFGVKKYLMLEKVVWDLLDLPAKGV